MPISAAARARCRSASGQTSPDIPTGPIPTGSRWRSPKSVAPISGVISPCRIEGDSRTASSITRLRRLVASAPVPLSRYSQTKRGMRAIARARRSEKAG